MGVMYPPFFTLKITPNVRIKTLTFINQHRGKTMENINCPHCGKAFQSVAEKIKLAAYSCPLCLKAISIQEDPLASKKGIVMALTREIKDLTTLLRGR